VRENYAEGIKRFFITDGQFRRNSEWEKLFDRMIEIAARARDEYRLSHPVDTLCHNDPGFIEKATRAGVRRAFIGLENINPET